MHSTLLVIRHELYKTLRSPGYVIFAYVIPIVAVLLVAIVKGNSGDAVRGSGINTSQTSNFNMAVEGYVDQSGLVQQLPENIPTDRLIKLADEATAQEALAYGAITAYYLVPADYLERGRVYYVYPNTRPYLDDGQPWVMEWTLLFNLLGGEMELVESVWDPIHEVFLTSLAGGDESGTGDDCSRPGIACQSNDLVRYMPSIMVALFFISFMTTSNMLFSSIGAEKENRMMEVLMLSVSPRQLLSGKTLGLGVAGLLQTVFWLAAIYISFNLGGTTLSLPENFEFPVNILAWSLVFFLGGFGVYANLMAGAGALVPKMKEAGAANYIAMFPLLVGYMFGIMSPMAETSDSALLIFLSFFPLTSPVVMPMRLTIGSAPLWQMLVSAGLLFLTAYYILHAVARMFHAQNLLSGEPFSLKRYFRAFAG